MIKQNPFSVYDFLGYFIPGALLIYLYLLIKYLRTLKTDFTIDKFLNSNKEFQIDQLLFFIILSYALGHLINFCSSQSIEKYSIWRYGYPSKYLLKLESDKYWKNNNKTGYLSRIVLPILIFPISIYDLILGEVLNFKSLYTKSLDPLLVKKVNIKAKNLNNLLFKGSEFPTEDDHDFFRIISHYTYENSKNHQSKLSNYVALYGFLRTLTLISVVAFWFCLYHIVRYNNCHITWVTLAVLGLLSYLFFMAFMKFYRRYTLEGLMLIAVDKELQEE